MGSYWFRRFCKFLILEKYHIAVCISGSSTHRKAPQIATISRGFLWHHTSFYFVKPDPLIFFKRSRYCRATFSKQPSSTAAVLHHVQNYLSKGTAVSHLSPCVYVCGGCNPISWRQGQGYWFHIWVCPAGKLTHPQNAPVCICIYIYFFKSVARDTV